MSAHENPSPAAFGLTTGAPFAGRFLIEFKAGQGGMGTVYRAVDQHTGEPVALKLLHADSSAAGIERFMREARMLAELRHSCIVRYVDHGRAPNGQFFLAMEWLSGVDLAHRLTQGPLSVRETWTLMHRAAQALDSAHNRQIVHRDLKPSNLFLRDGHIDRAVLLDFGIARQGLAAGALTATGALIGTPRYMSPEQARGLRELTPAADIFALGALAFECLCGRPVFDGNELVTVLGAILFEPTPEIRSLRADVPEALDALVLRMLAKETAGRPPDAKALLCELEALAPSINTIEDTSKTIVLKPPVPRAAPRAHEEQRHFAVLLAMHDHQIDNQSETIRSSDTPNPLDQTLKDELSAAGVRAEWLPDGSLMASSQGGQVSDQAALLAGAALSIRARWPHLRLSIATGRASPNAALHIGEAFQRALSPLRSGAVGPGEIALDELSGQLLEGRFQIESDRHGRRLVTEKSFENRARRLLGKPTACVGREQELAILDATLASVIEDAAAKSILITAAAGMGKSRLLQEFLKRACLRAPEFCILYGAGDPMTAGSPYGIIAQAIRRHAGIEGETDKQKALTLLFDRIAQNMDGDEGRRVAEFLSVLCGVPCPDEHHPRLRAARSDPRLMKAQTEQAFCDFLRAECEKNPIVLVLEDIHWGDALGARLIDVALRELCECPLMIAAFGRPETRDLFPKLSNGPARQEIVLQGLSKKASEKLVRAVLGKDVDAAIVERIVIQSEGNALFLEELIRAAAEGKHQGSPESVLLMLEARILRLGAEERLVLRAASIFGTAFFRSGVAALLDRDAQSVDAPLETLIEEEIIERRRVSRLASEPEFAFRHALLREAAHGLSHADDRAHWHARAARFLLDMGEPDPAVLGEHWEHAGHLAEAARCFTDAVELSIKSNDIDGNAARIARAHRCQPQGETLGKLKVLELQLYIWKMRWKDALSAGHEAMRLLPVDSIWHRRARSTACVLSGLVSQNDRFAMDVIALANDRPTPAHLPVYIEALTALLSVCALRAEREAAAVLIQRIGEYKDAVDPGDLRLRGPIASAFSEYMRAFDTDPWQQVQYQKYAFELTMQYGDIYYQLVAAAFTGQTLAELGAFEEGDELLVRMLEHGKKNGPIYPMTSARIHLAALLLQSGDAHQWQRAWDLSRTVLETPEAPGGFRAWATSLLAELSLRRGALFDALEKAKEALGMESPSAWRKILLNSLLVRIYLALGQSQEAAALAKQLLSELDAHGGAGYVEVSALVAIALALRASGDAAASNFIINRAYSTVWARARKIPDAHYRSLYLGRCPENAEALALAREWNAVSDGPQRYGENIS